jgi:LacI family transcriptional regulator
MDNTDTFTLEANKILESPPDGILLAPWAKRESLKFTRELDLKGIPYVFIDSNLGESNPISFIVQDSVQSGYLAAKLIDYGIHPESNIVIIHITKDLQNANHMLLREKGFMDYLDKVKEKQHRVCKIEVPSDENEITYKLNTCLAKMNTIDAIFVTNSKVHLVAGFINQSEARPNIIGYDLISKNIELLINGKIDFLLNQKPESQGYVATHLLFDHIVRKETVKNTNYTSIDIITRENIDYYSSL